MKKGGNEQVEEGRTRKGAREGMTLRKITLRGK